MSMYLGMTALQEFWPENGKVWLLSRGCLPNLDASDCHGNWQIAGIVSDPFESDGDAEFAYKEIWRIASEVIVWLSARLNALHDVNHSERYWRTHIGFWVLLFVSVIYDRHAHLLKAKDEVPGITVIGIDATQTITPIDTIDFVHQVTDDLYNQQIYTALAKKLGINISHHKLSGIVGGLEKRAAFKGKGLKRFLKTLGQLGYATFCSLFARKADLLMVSSYLPRKFEIALLLSSFGKIAPLYSLSTLKVPDSGPDEAMRSAFSVGSNAASVPIESLTSAVLDLVAMCIPRAFVEDYTEISRNSERVYGRYKPKGIYSASAWWFDEPFKHWAAQCQERGAILIGAEHGSAAFIGKYKLTERMEIEISDFFVTWGWDSDVEPKIIPLPANKLINIRKRYTEKIGNGILYIATAHARHNVGMVEDFSNYVDWQTRFFQAVSCQLTGEILVRLYQHDYGWKMKNRLEKISDQLRFDDWRIIFRKRLRDCRLCIFDYVSTTFAEALASNVPAILFFNQEKYPINMQMASHFRALKDAKILHDSPESAAAWASQVYESPSTWWHSPECQAAVRGFCEMYAYQHRAPLKEWKGRLEALMDRQI